MDPTLIIYSMYTTKRYTWGIQVVYMGIHWVYIVYMVYTGSIQVLCIAHMGYMIGIHVVYMRCTCCVHVVYGSG